MTEAASIWGQQRELWRWYFGPDELVTTTEASAEIDDPEKSATTTETSEEEAEETTHLKERLQHRRQRCVYGPR